MHVQFESPDREGASYAGHAVRQLRRALRGLHAVVRRVEVRLEDDNGPDEGGIDKRCRMTLELAGGRATGIDARSRAWQPALDAAISRVRDRVLGKPSAGSRSAMTPRRGRRVTPRLAPQPA